MRAGTLVALLACLLCSATAKPLFAIGSGALLTVGDELPNCDVYHENQCQGNNIETDAKYTNWTWQTPPKGDANYQPSFQSYSSLKGHARVVYNSAHNQATVQLVTIVRDPNVKLTYSFGGVIQESNTKVFCQSGCENVATGPVNIDISGSDGSSLTLDAVDFLWNAPAIKLNGGDYRNGQKGAIVEMFGWPHADVEKECKAISQMGYLGVKLFPVQEQVMSDEPFNGERNPWYFMYQPVSYRLQGRMGTRDQLRALITTCRSYGVRVYADAVVNHMTGSGNDVSPYHRNPGAGCAKWGSVPKTGSAPDPSPFYTQGFTYHTSPIGYPPQQEFPAVPFEPVDFHCERSLNSWSDPLVLNAGWLTGLTDLNTERPNVQQRIADYLTDLISIGFSGYRIDAAKHIKPDDLVGIFSKFKQNLGGVLPEDFISWLEVLIGGEGQLLFCNEGSGYNYGKNFVDKFKAAGFSDAEVNKIKIWFTGYPKEPTVDCGQVTNWRKAIQNDDNDQQNDGSSSRDMGDQGSVLVKDRGFEVKLFQSPNGANDNANDYPIRLVLSSYYFDKADGKVHGIPDGKSDCLGCKGPNCSGCKSVPYSPAYVADACAYEGQDYTRVHRDRAIVLAMRQWMGLPTNLSNEQLGIPARCQ
eukprot:Colp12_sorted_trinity150504_noHs@268